MPKQRTIDDKETALSFELSELGWTSELQETFEQLGDERLEPARVAAEHRGSYRIFTAAGETSATVPGKMTFDAITREELPAVGDWVAVEVVDATMAVIRSVLPRRTSFVRKVAGFQSEAQVLAANVDVVFIVDPFDRGPNLRRIERFLTVAWESGAMPVVVLTKSDLAIDLGEDLANVIAVAPAVDVYAVSSLTGDGIEELLHHLDGAPTIAALGPSGAGKSSLINALLGRDVMETKEVRLDGKGRHTTTHRQLIPLPGGGAFIDTPGMRELQLYDGDDGIDMSFSDIYALAEQCRFRNCSHEREPGCAVAAALRNGTLDESRYASYRKQLRELAAVARKKDKRLANEAAKKWKKVSREAKARARIR
jgi:ribosome biogenesis GTPase / thiamine phosphate phosphatase